MSDTSQAPAERPAGPLLPVPVPFTYQLRNLHSAAGELVELSLHLPTGVTVVFMPADAAGHLARELTNAATLARSGLTIAPGSRLSL